MFVLGMMLFGVDLFMFLQILRTLERLLAYLANMWFEWRMDCQAREGYQRCIRRRTHKVVTSEMTGDVISFCASRTTIFPSASEAKVVGTLATDVVVAEVVIEDFGIWVGLSAVDPKADQDGFLRGVRDWGWLLLRGGGFGSGWLWGGFSPC
jgi:hypothetical protein